ncbi:MAG: hypothetical protein LC797_04765 [Chloroflexi bacterium]|nr:hypothetical protein [Chloroflexota bacterium]
MVALAPRVAGEVAVARHGARRWYLATAVVLVCGVGARLAVHGGGVGDRSAAVMMALLGVCAWTALTLLATARTAFGVTLGLVALLELAALPARTVTEYDDRQAFYGNDQILSAQVPSAPRSLDAQTSPTLALLAEPTYSGAQPRFGLAGTVSGVPLAWECPFQHGLQRLVLPVPRAALAGAAQSIDVQLHLTGSPSRESDYLLGYASSARGGFLVSLGDADADATSASPSASTVTCSLRTVAAMGATSSIW